MKLRTAAQMKAAVEHALKIRVGCGAASCLLDPQPGAVKASCSCDNKKIRGAIFWVRQVMRDVAGPEEIADGAVSRLRAAAAGVPVAADTACNSEIIHEYTAGEMAASAELVCIGCGAEPSVECNEGCWASAVEDAVGAVSEGTALTLDVMPEALASMVRLAHEYLDDAVCDHPRGECWCAQVGDLRRAEALLPPKKPVSEEANQ